jgi:catechol 2,3-dioxygenase-like lactoylglutathione lyase family enzyme
VPGRGDQGDDSERGYDDQRREDVVSRRLEGRADVGEIFTWLRSDHEHHSLAVVGSEHAGLDHYSFDVNCWDDLKTWCDELATKGQLIGWGPGRHGPGNNLFVIFTDPAGHRVELSAEMERYWDDRADQEPRRWQPKPETVNLWGPVPSWRKVD